MSFVLDFFAILRLSFVSSSTNLAIPQTVVQDPEVHHTCGHLLSPLQPAKILWMWAYLRLPPGPPCGAECKVMICLHINCEVWVWVYISLSAWHYCMRTLIQVDASSSLSPLPWGKAGAGQNLSIELDLPTESLYCLYMKQGYINQIFWEVFPVYCLGVNKRTPDTQELTVFTLTSH